MTCRGFGAGRSWRPFASCLLRAYLPAQRAYSCPCRLKDVSTSWLSSKVHTTIEVGFLRLGGGANQRSSESEGGLPAKI
ncbi:unnamed protein product [Linum trigynum]|uniref:Secreted protein n=1 Tax=Linum trigynum TaxID=586398 RepID=A0AAV2DKW3_9ROSI